MNGWAIVAVAAALGYAAKLAGYVVPARVVAGPRASRIVALLPVALLAALAVEQTFRGTGDAITVDARLPALAVAVALLVARANFLVVVVAAAVVAAALRGLGLG